MIERTIKTQGATCFPLNAVQQNIGHKKPRGSEPRGFRLCFAV